MPKVRFRDASTGEEADLTVESTFELREDHARLTHVFEFDAEAHTYHLDGKRLPGITEVCGLVDREWFAGEWAETGRLVHKLCTLNDHGTYSEDMTDDDDVKAKVRCWQQFCLDFKFKPTLIEYPMYSEKYGYAGTLDRFGVIDMRQFEGREGLFEIKSGSTVPKVVGLQTAAQEQLVTENYGYVQVPRFVVHLQPGRTPPYRLSRCQEKSDFNVFAGLLLGMKWKMLHG